MKRLDMKEVKFDWDYLCGSRSRMPECNWLGKILLFPLALVAFAFITLVPLIFGLLFLKDEE